VSPIAFSRVKVLELEIFDVCSIHVDEPPYLYLVY
jgi:hypothetical protein